MLLDANAPVLEKDNNENEPIHLAAKAGSEEIIRLIKQYGGTCCRPGIQNYSGHYYQC
jgi:ankyrin repeat protein